MSKYVTKLWLIPCISMLLLWTRDSARIFVSEVNGGQLLSLSFQGLRLLTWHNTEIDARCQLHSYTTEQNGFQDFLEFASNMLRCVIVFSIWYNSFLCESSNKLLYFYCCENLILTFVEAPTGVQACGVIGCHKTYCGLWTWRNNQKLSKDRDQNTPLKIFGQLEC